MAVFLAIKDSVDTDASFSGITAFVLTEASKNIRVIMSI